MTASRDSEFELQASMIFSSHGEPARPKFFLGANGTRDGGIAEFVWMTWVQLWMERPITSITVWEAKG